jgi:hypothetical protein
MVTKDLTYSKNQTSFAVSNRKYATIFDQIVEREIDNFLEQVNYHNFDPESLKQRMTNIH